LKLLQESQSDTRPRI